MCGICGNTFSELGQLKDHRTLDHKIAKTKSSIKTGKRNSQSFKKSIIFIEGRFKKTKN